jgi:two-component system, response regulator
VNKFYLHPLLNGATLCRRKLVDGTCRLIKDDAMRTILYVEDDPYDRELMTHAVSTVNPGFELRIQEDYFQIIDYLRNQGAYEKRQYFPAPELVLLDYSLGDFKGTDLLFWIRTKSEFPSLPVVMYSGSTEDHIVAKCYAMGANSFIAKPDSATDLLNIVGALGACLQTSPPAMEKLEKFALWPSLARQSLTQELHQTRAERAASLKQQRELRMHVDRLGAELKDHRRKRHGRSGLPDTEHSR